MYQVTFTFINLKRNRKAISFRYNDYAQALAKRSTFTADLTSVGCKVQQAIIETK